jgi:hypothetical protein
LKLNRPKKYRIPVPLTWGSASFTPGYYNVSPSGFFLCAFEGALNHCAVANIIVCAQCGLKKTASGEAGQPE